jgi:hypothetical protein
MNFYPSFLFPAPVPEKPHPRDVISLRSNSHQSFKRNENDAEQGSKITSNDPSFTHKKSDLADQVLNRIAIDSAKSCTHGDNPYLTKLCPSLDEIQIESIARDLQNITLKDIEESILNDTIVKKLKMKCFTGDWCLSESFFVNKNPKSQPPIYEMALNRNFNNKILCQYAKCAKEVHIYIDNCGDLYTKAARVSHDILNIAGQLCSSLNVDSSGGMFCAEQTLRMIHVAAAAFEPQTNNKLQSNKTKNVQTNVISTNIFSI